MPIHSTSKLNVLVATPPPVRGLDLEKAPKEDKEQIAPGYQLESTLGAGACGIVYRARRLASNQVVALKVVTVDPNAAVSTAARFQKEISTLAKLDHPNIVKLYDSGRNNKQLYFAMELLHGEDLGQRLKRNGKLGERAAWEVVRQTAEALAHASKVGITHRDIKPANLFLITPPKSTDSAADTPVVKVTDFGLALTTHGDGNEDRLTATGVVLGTPIYMSPEQFRMSKIDHRGDIYSLGATAFHMLSGSPPFGGANVWDVMVQKMEEQPRLKPPVSPESIQLVHDMMVADPDARIGTYEELIARINSLSVFKEAPKPADPAERVRTRRGWGLVAGLAVAIGGLCLTQYVVRQAIHAVQGTDPATSATAKGPALSPADFETTGFFENLFDGTPASMAGWEGYADLHDAGKKRVLGIYNESQKSFATSENFRLTYRVDLHDARAVEIGVPVRPAMARPVVRLSKSGAVVVGTRSGGEFVTRGEAVSDLIPKDSRGVFHEVRLDKIGATWHVVVNGQQVATVPDVETNPRVASIAAEGGEVRVEAVKRDDLGRKAP